MIVPDCPPCDIQNLPGMGYVLATCFCGAMGCVALAALLKAWEYTLSIREYRLQALHRRGK